MGVITADTCHGNSVPSVFGGLLVREEGVHLRQNSSKKHLYHSPILLEVGTRVLDDGLDDDRRVGLAMMTTAPVRGRGGAPASHPLCS
jgi:hypothetical protein